MRQNKAMAPEVRAMVCRLERWRRNKEGGRSIPEPLWDGAAALARRFGISRISQVLGLNYYALKKRVEGIEQPLGNAAEPAPFVEVEVDRSAWGPQCLIELESATGSKMSLRLQGPCSAELAAVAQSFWSQSQ